MHCLVIYFLFFIYFGQCGRLKTVVSADDLDSVICDKMEYVSGCKLPIALKLKISQLVDKHSFNCGSSFNLDIISLGNVSKDFQDMFAKLMRHVCTIDLRSKELIVDVMEAIAQTDPSVEDDDPLSVAASPDEDKSDPVIVPGMKGDCCCS